MNGHSPSNVDTTANGSSVPRPSKPIFLATHSRSCSTAFERIFIGQSKNFKCVHEPFGEAFYFGPERISDNIDYWPLERLTEIEPYQALTYARVAQDVLKCVEQNKEKTVFVKDMAYHIVLPISSDIDSVPSFRMQIESEQRNAQESPKANPTLLPTSVLGQFNFVFLIRDPELSVPSKYRLYLPPIADPRCLTPDRFKDKEVGYREVRMLIEYFYPRHAACDASIADSSGPVVVDASDLLANPEGILRTFCHRVGITFTRDMLQWTSDDEEARALFQKFQRCHQDAMLSTGLYTNTADEQRRMKLTGNAAATREEMEHEWRERYGVVGASKIRDTVDACREHYQWLKRFTISSNTGIT